MDSAATRPEGKQRPYGWRGSLWTRRAAASSESTPTAFQGLFRLRLSLREERFMLGIYQDRRVPLARGEDCDGWHFDLLPGGFLPSVQGLQGIHLDGEHQDAVPHGNGVCREVQRLF